MRRPFPGIAALLLAAAVPACGDPSPTATSDSAPAAQPSPRPAARAERADAASAALAAAEIEALVAEWNAAEWGPARRALQDRIVAGGDAVLGFLVARFVAEQRGSDFELLVAFGAAAVGPLLERLGGASPEGRAQIVALLGALAPAWRETDQGAAVCRALLPLLQDEDVRSEVAQTLASGRPAGRAIARELGDLWTSGDDVARSLAAEVIRALGPDAAPAAPALVAALAYVPPAPTGDEDSDPTASDEESAKLERCENAATLLREIGACEPSVLEELRKRLAPGAFPRVQTLAASVLRTWGDAAAAAAPDLLRLLGDPSADVRDSAMWALSAIPAQQELVWESVSAAIVRGDDWTRDGSGWAMETVARHREFGPRLTKLVATLPPEAAFALADAIGYRDSRVDWTVVAPALIASPDPEARQFALYAWDEDPERRPLPERAADWLDDPDPSVRAYAAAILARRGGAPPDRIRDVALDLLRSDNPGDRRDAVRALAEVAIHDARALDALVAALGADPHDSVREEAADALAMSDAPIPGDPTAAAAWVAGRIERRIAAHAFQEARASFVDAILRLRGGDEALAAAIVRAVGAAAHSSDFEFVAAAAERAGPRVGAARATLARVRSEMVAGDATAARCVDAALAAIDADAMAIARTSMAQAQETVRRLLTMGDAGRGAVVVYAGRIGVETETWRSALGAVDLSAEIAAAARSGGDGPDDEDRRQGAARLALLLPASRALDVLTTLFVDTSASVRSAAEASLLDLETGAPGTIPVGLVGRWLGEPDRLPFAAVLAGRLGPRAAELVPALRRIRDSGAAETRPMAAIALWRITRDAAESLPTLRATLASLAELGVPADELASVLAEMPLGRPDLDAVLALLRSPVADWAGPLFAPLLERFGADAAPAVPALRRMLVGREYDDEDAGPSPAMSGAVAARVLAAIGLAARPAIPDLRKWAAETGDPSGVARDAIRRIESSP